MPASPGNATQLITVDASGSSAQVAGWELRNGAWVKVLGPYAGRIGSNGLANPTTRVQGSRTTPRGTYTLTEAFGISGDPGTKLPYWVVGPDDWWVGDSTSPYYNQHRLGSQGGFALTSKGFDGSERLIEYNPAYRHAVVIDFNRYPAVPPRGSAIFLHVGTGGATAGCVSVSAAPLVALMKWLDPARNPRIAIG